MVIVLVPPPLIGRVWHEVEQWLEPATRFSRGRNTVETLRTECDAGNSHLWMAINEANECVGAATTHVANYPAGRWLVVGFLGAKDLPRYLEKGMAAIEAFARACGCMGMLIQGRNEWGRVLGFDPVHVTHEKRFSDG